MDIQEGQIEWKHTSVSSSQQIIAFPNLKLLQSIYVIMIHCQVVHMPLCCMWHTVAKPYAKPYAKHDY